MTNIKTLKARGGDDRVCHHTTSFFEKNKNVLSVTLEDEIEKEIFRARAINS